VPPEPGFRDAHLKHDHVFNAATAPEPKRGCPPKGPAEPPAEPEPKRPRGRPRKEK
jgi:hypothetical protein